MSADAIKSVLVVQVPAAVALFLTVPLLSESQLQSLSSLPNGILVGLGVLGAAYLLQILLDVIVKAALFAFGAIGGLVAGFLSFNAKIVELAHSLLLAYTRSESSQMIAKAIERFSAVRDLSDLTDKQRGRVFARALSESGLVSLKPIEQALLALKIATLCMIFSAIYLFATQSSGLIGGGWFIEASLACVVAAVALCVFAIVEAVSFWHHLCSVSLAFVVDGAPLSDEEMKQ
ncbi:MAG: hypothetical protein AAFR96_11445 [Planctomycetota bacterium]